MTLQNRVDPFGNIHAVSPRGQVMGNRGKLHNQHQKITHFYRNKRWIICKLNFKDRQRQVMATDNYQYTELFFLDEATALAAGHRPCWRCNRANHQRFMAYWQTVHPQSTRSVDEILHRERTLSHQPRQHSKVDYRISINSLPYGTFITIAGQPYILLEETMRPWKFTGYGQALLRWQDTKVRVLTPESTVAVLAAGYRPEVSEV
ncbi:hypothetical protein QUF64_00940 [Anaerolineales bacterium HSG6]|nr:hypothetical protein [Anaerolineales bacterium HSG6]MDM8530491.1 hypothetical protein [Anaerolineales bacterium HSG25]